MAARAGKKTRASRCRLGAGRVCGPRLRAAGVRGAPPGNTPRPGHYAPWGSGLISLASLNARASHPPFVACSGPQTPLSAGRGPSPVGPARRSPLSLPPPRLLVNTKTQCNCKTQSEGGRRGGGGRPNSIFQKPNAKPSKAKPRNSPAGHARGSHSRQRSARGPPGGKKRRADPAGQRATAKRGHGLGRLARLEPSGPNLAERLDTKGGGCGGSGHCSWLCFGLSCVRSVSPAHRRRRSCVSLWCLVFLGFSSSCLLLVVLSASRAGVGPGLLVVVAFAGA